MARFKSSFDFSRLVPTNRDVTKCWQVRFRHSPAIAPIAFRTFKLCFSLSFSALMIVFHLFNTLYASNPPQSSAEVKERLQ
jgi:hypothetical protein